MTDITKRMNYFDHQFLREGDLNLQQDYHLDRHRRHNHLQHTWGVADGLAVEFVSAATAVTVRPGTAIDGEGREIVLAADDSVELSGVAAGQDVYITVSYTEELSDPTVETGAAGDTRWSEIPLIEASVSLPTNAELKLVLAFVTRSGTTVTNVDNEIRARAGVVGGDLQVTSMTMTDPGVIPTQWPSMSLGAAQQAKVTGSLRISQNLIVDGTITGDIVAGTVQGVDIVDGAITNTKLANDSVTAAKIANGAVSNSELANNSVDANKIAANSVNTSELVNGSVTNAKLANNSVNATKIVDGSVSTAELANGAVTNAKLANGAVTNAKLANGAVTNAKLANGAVTNAKLANNSVDANKIAANAVSTSEIADNAVPFSKISSIVNDGTGSISPGSTVTIATVQAVTTSNGGHRFVMLTAYITSGAGGYLDITNRTYSYVSGSNRFVSQRFLIKNTTSTTVGYAYRYQWIRD